MQKSTGTKIDKLLDVLEISQLEFANRLKVSSGAITNWKKRDLGINVINKIVNAYPEVSYHWLITGEGEILKEPIRNKVVNEYQLEQQDITKRINGILSESKLTAEMFAIEVGIETSDFCDKIEGRVLWTVADINKICKRIGVRKGWLIDGEGQKFKAPDEVLDTIPVTPTDKSKQLENASELFTDQSLRLEKFIVMLSDEIAEVRSIKKELSEELGTIRDLKATLHDAIKTFRSSSNTTSSTLMAAEGEY